MTDMQLKENTRYRLANGEIVGPLCKDLDGYWFITNGDPVCGMFIGMWLDDGTTDMFLIDDHPKNKLFRIVEEVEE